MLTRRTNVLFDEADYANLLMHSRERNKTIGELVRQAVKKTYKVKKTLTENEKAYRMIEKATKGLDFSGIDYKALINYGRKY
ncbi:MAG: hypothetical protein Q8P91_03655 [bacterium]|nr:hypothetical protein [bacterium]